MSNFTETSDCKQKCLIEGLWSYFWNDSIERKKEKSYSALTSFELKLSVPYPGNIPCHDLETFHGLQALNTGVKVPCKIHCEENKSGRKFQNNWSKHIKFYSIRIISQYDCDLKRDVAENGKISLILQNLSNGPAGINSTVLFWIWF